MKTVHAIGPVEEHDDERGCESCAEDTTETAPASNGGRLCAFCAEQGVVPLWMPAFLRNDPTYVYLNAVREVIATGRSMVI